MKRFLKGALFGLFLSLLLLGAVTAHTVMQMQTDGRLINYVGIVRGATQRLVKRELAGQPSDDMVGYLDGILQELNGGGGGYGLPVPKDRTYQEELGTLTEMWDRVKREIDDYRSGRQDGGELLALSEQYFDQANDTVFAAEAYSSRQTRILLVVVGVMFFLMLLTWAFILWAYMHKLLSLEHSNKQLSEQARRDPLTGVYKLDAFREEAQRLLDSEQQERFAVVYTDFADFKYVNDVFGYAYGDGILARYGEILRAGLREKEAAGRVSADNFVLLVRYGDRREVVARQRQADQEITEFMRSSSEQSLPSYCGICCVEDVVEELKIDGLLDRANFARKTVKNGTNPNYVYYNDSIRQRLWAEKDIENRMLEALKRREFKVYYQPKVELKTGRIACAEALVRWQGADGVVIPPDRFIPVFERKFLINRLDQYVFEEVCRWLRHLLDEGREALPVSVNVSRLQFYDRDFICRYVEIRNEYRIPPELLEIEFTESIVFDNTDRLLKIVNALKREGFSCSIDDFGKGYSSLSLLKNLPVDVLKIDGFFFTEGSDRERDMAVVQSIVELVRKFDIRTVAEGIETPEQVEYLRQIGCDYVQGYVFYKPMPQGDYEALLADETMEVASR